MNHTFIIARRVLTQLKGDRRFLALSIIGPLIIVYFLKLLFNTFPPMIDVKSYTMPFTAFIVHFLSFILCAILLVQERINGTLERMMIGGFSKTSIIGGYTLGYFGLATIQAITVLAESIWLFKLSYDTKTVVLLFIVIWLLAIVSVMLGIFISTFAKHEAHVFPFIPLIILPSVFLTGLIIKPDGLPLWAQIIGKCLPIHYAVNIIHEIIKPTYTITDTLLDYGILTGYIFALLVLASLTLKETE
ncbi:MAG TPA: ABC transporter permease [Prolixibacteraceae bacterium]|jgi:ABC-2 type transport system permease protein|nr:ABC transporter permease [Prolixibacteraceae bacterium]